MFKQFILHSTYRFKRFLNKSYAAFCSMHREVTIGTVSRRIADLELLKAGKLALTICSTSLAVSTLYAAESVPDQEVDNSLLQLQEVSVVAQSSQFQSQAFRLVTNISADELKSLPVRTVTDILKYLPSVDLRERGPSGIQADLSMRAGTAKQVIVLLNGVNITDSQTEHYSLDIPVDVALIERIEILQGTNYQLDAFSGAINIITKDNEKLKNTKNDNTNYDVVASITAGQHALVNPALAAKIKRNNWFLNTSASYNRSNGYIADTDYKLSNIFLQTGYKGLDCQIGMQMKNAGASNFYSVGNANQYDATRTLFTTVSYQNQWGGWAINANAYYRAHYDQYQYYRNGLNAQGDTIPNASAYNNTHWTHTAGTHIAASWNNDWQKTNFGIDIRNEYIESTNLGTHNRLNIRYFAEERMYWEKFSLAFGANGNYNTQFNNDWGAGANFGYKPIKNLQFFLNFNRSIRLPNFTDLYYKQKRADGQFVRLADPNTKAEKATQLEFAAKYDKSIKQNGHFWINASAFYRWGKDIIDWVKEDDDNIVTYRSTNHSKVNATGVETAIGVSYKWLKCLEVSYSFNDATANSGQLISLYALDYLKHKAVLKIEHQIYKGLAASWCLRYENRNGNYTDSQGKTQNYKPVCLLDGSIYWANQWAKVGIDCKNMTAQQYYDFGGVEQPQEWISAKVELRFVK